MPINSTVAFAYIQNTVSNTALTLEDFGFTSTQVQRASRCYVFVNTESIRVLWTGDIPTTTEGVLVEVGFEIYEENIKQLQMIRNGTTDSEIIVVLES